MSSRLPIAAFAITATAALLTGCGGEAADTAESAASEATSGAASVATDAASKAQTAASKATSAGESAATKAGTAAKSAASKATSAAGGDKSYTMAQVAQRNSATSCWTVIDKNVYDLTKWAAQHPGGKQRILDLCGTNGTAKFRAQHDNAKRQADILDGYKIGTLS